MIQVLFIPGWTPTPLNKLMGGMGKRGTIYRHTLKKADVEQIVTAARAHDARKATGPRQVDIHLVMPEGKRRCDRDAYWKVVKDSLKHAGLLMDDTPRLCRDGKVSYSKAMDGGEWGTFLLLADVQ